MSAYLLKRAWRGWGKIRVYEIADHFHVCRRTAQLWLAALEKSEWIGRDHGTIHLWWVRLTVKTCPAINALMDEIRRQEAESEIHFAGGATHCALPAEPPPISGIVEEVDTQTPPLSPSTTTTPAPDAVPAQKAPELPQNVAEALAVLKAKQQAYSREQATQDQEKPVYRSRAAERLRAAREACQPVDLTDPLLSRVMAAEARSAAPQPPPLPKPRTLWEALERLGDPLVTAPEVAGMLAITFSDHKTVSYRFFCGVIERAKMGLIAVDAVVKAVRFALAAKNPGAYFVRCCS